LLLIQYSESNFGITYKSDINKSFKVFIEKKIKRINKINILYYISITNRENRKTNAKVIINFLKKLKKKFIKYGFLYYD
jgi:ABC-type molybdate transport system substrate-binding protein